MNRVAKVFVLGMLVNSGAAIAHPNHDTDPAEAKVAPAPKVKHTIETSSQDGKTRISISRGTTKVGTANAVGVLVVDGKSPRTEYVLQPAGDNTMITRDAPKLAPGTRVTVAVSVPGQPNIQEEVTLR